MSGADNLNWIGIVAQVTVRKPRFLIEDNQQVDIGIVALITIAIGLTSPGIRMSISPSRWPGPGSRSRCLTQVIFGMSSLLAVTLVSQ